MKGYELIQKIANREIKQDSKIKVRTEGKYKTTISYENDGLKWKTGEFNTSILCNRNTEFELDEENKEIKELYEWVTRRNGEVTQIEGKILETANKVNELVRAVNKLIKETE